MDLRLNSQKANRELQWTPRLPLPDALAWTAEWYRRHAQGASARDLCIEQIERYAARVS
jgi:CDP-glucose 4,6-dehydratase